MMITLADNATMGTIVEEEYKRYERKSSCLFLFLVFLSVKLKYYLLMIYRVVIGGGKQLFKDNIDAENLSK